MTSIKTQKAELREKMLEFRHNMPKDRKDAAEKKITESFFKLASVRFAETILLYYPVRDELDVIKIAETAISLGKRIAFPISDPVLPKMDFYFADDFSKMKSGAFGIPEPPENARIYNLDGEHDVCVLPAVSFDRSGHRLGYGKGYYDRFLPHFKGAKIGLCISDMLVEKLPNGKFDIPADVIVTEKGVIIPHE